MAKGKSSPQMRPLETKTTEQLKEPYEETKRLAPPTKKKVRGKKNKKKGKTSARHLEEPKPLPQTPTPPPPAAEKKEKLSTKPVWREKEPVMSASPQSHWSGRVRNPTKTSPAEGKNHLPSWRGYQPQKVSAPQHQRNKKPYRHPRPQQFIVERVIRELYSPFPGEYHKYAPRVGEEALRIEKPSHKIWGPRKQQRREGRRPAEKTREVRKPTAEAKAKRSRREKRE